MGQGSPKNSIKTHGNAKLRKWPRKPKGNKQARDTQGKTNGTQELASDIIKKPMAVLDHWEKNKWQAQRGLARLRKNKFTAGMIEWYGRRG